MVTSTNRNTSIELTTINPKSTIKASNLDRKIAAVANRSFEYQAKAFLHSAKDFGKMVIRVLSNAMKKIQDAYNRTFPSAKKSEGIEMMPIRSLPRASVPREVKQVKTEARFEEMSARFFATDSDPIEIKDYFPRSKPTKNFHDYSQYGANSYGDNARWYQSNGSAKVKAKEAPVLSELDQKACKLLGVTNPCDYQKMLGVKDGASDKEIKAAFNKKAVLFHPDKVKSNKESHGAAFNLLNLAKEALLRTAPKARKSESEDIELGTIPRKETKGATPAAKWTIPSFEIEEPAKKPILKQIEAPVVDKSAESLETALVVYTPKKPASSTSDVELMPFKAATETARPVSKPADLEMTTIKLDASAAG